MRRRQAALAPQLRDVLAGLQEAANLARDYIASLPAEYFPTMVSLADEFAFAGRDERFEMLIDIFVDGLARRAAQADRSAGSSTGSDA